MTTVKNALIDATLTAPHVDVNSLPEHPTKLLVADDEHLVASGLASTLTTLGYEVVGPASDGSEAIDLSSSAAPDLALLDIRMSRVDGLCAGEVLFRQMGVPVVIFSAYSDPEYVNEGNRIGVFGYLLKPVSADQLRVGISLAWGRYLDYMQQASEIHNLRQRLEDRKTIEQAKWLLVKTSEITEPEAMKALQREARNNRRRLVDVAREVVENDGAI